MPEALSEVRNRSTVDGLEATHSRSGMGLKGIRFTKAPASRASRASSGTSDRSSFTPRIIVYSKVTRRRFRSL